MASVSKRTKKVAKPRNVSEEARKLGISPQALGVQKRKGQDAHVAVRIQEADLRRKILEGDKLERLLAVLDGQFLPRDSVEQSVREVSHVINTLLRAILSELPLLADGLDAAHIETELEGWVEGWERKLKNVKDRIWSNAKKAVEKELRGDLKKVAASKHKHD